MIGCNSEKPPTGSRRRTVFIFILVLLVTLPLLIVFRSQLNTSVPDAKTHSPAEAKSIFQTLHRNIYDTFNEPTADAAYDRLARSVDEPLLEDIYKEVYHYFTGLESGGPSIEIVDVKLRQFEELSTPGNLRKHGTRFRVQASWDVLSIVTHFKHWHPRTNNYKAIYTLGLVEGEWKIVEDEILWQRRIPFDLASFKS